MSSRFPRQRGLLLLLLAALVVPSCASLPDKGPVRQGLRLQVDREESAVRPIGQPPVPGADPRSIVLGFLSAGADFDGDHRVARQYLAPSIRQRWKPRVVTVIYNRSEGDLSAVLRRDGKVVVNAPAVARIESDGQYVAARAGTPLERTFGLARVSGEWRIARVDDGLLLARTTVAEVYRQLNLYFLSPSAKVLVPDTILLPALPGLPTQLVSRLLRGPTSALRGAVTTGFPSGSSLAVTSVPISDGVASVRLDAAAARANEDDRVTMAAQLVWTLKQLPEFRSLRVTADGAPLDVSGAPDLQPRDRWLTYDPAALREEVTPYVIRAGRVGLLLGGKFVPVGGPAGDGTLAARSVAVSLDLTRLAVVSADGRSLLVGRLRPAQAPARRFVGTDLSPPSWDSLGNVWVADRRTGRLWFIPGGNAKPVPVALEDFASAGPVTAVRVARDGARLALVAGLGARSRLYVGAVLRDREGGAVTQVRALREVLPALHHVRDIAWADATNLAVIGRLDEDADVPVVTDTAGYETSSIQLQPGLVSIAAAPAKAVVAGTASGQVQQYASGEWDDIGEGTNPAYPG